VRSNLLEEPIVPRLTRQGWEAGVVRLDRSESPAVVNTAKIVTRVRKGRSKSDDTLRLDLSVVVFAFMIVGCATAPQLQPIIVQQPAPAPVVEAKPPAPVDPRIGLSPEVLAALQDPEHPTVHQGIVTIYPYSEDKEYKLSCAPLRATEIRLNNDETFEQAGLGDTARWSVQGADHTVLVKALGDTSDPKMATNAIIATSKRSYHLGLKLGHFTQAVSWYYPAEYESALAAYQGRSR
jgi:hypothetical protein